MDDVTPVIAALQRSGFPMQTRVEHEIRARTVNGWRVAASEHPWIDRDADQEQFIDLVAAYDRRSKPRRIPRRLTLGEPRTPRRPSLFPPTYKRPKSKPKATARSIAATMCRTPCIVMARSHRLPRIAPKNAARTAPVNRR